MTVSITTTKVQYNGDDATTVFPYTFKIWNTSDLTVILTDTSSNVDTVKTLNVDYTVSGAGSGTGGNVTFTAAPTSDQEVTILRSVPLTQATDWVENDPFPATSTENAMDKLTMAIQDINEGLGRAAKVRRGYSGSANLILPDPDANKVLAWDATATALTNLTTTTVTVPQIDYIGNYGSSLNTAVSSIGATPKRLLINEAVTLTANVTVPATLVLEISREGSIALDGYTLTINGTIVAGPYQILDDAAISIGTSIAYDVWWTTPVTDPEGAVTAEIGSLFILTSGTEPIVYVKESGSGNTGWAALISESATASETRAGLVERATDVEAAAGSDTTRYTSAKQMHDQIKAQVPSSCIMMWPTETPPTGWLECNGAAVSRVTYSALFAVISTMYGAGDGSTTFNLPDMRGQFVRGWDNSAGNDPDAATRTDRGDGTLGDHVGTLQADELASHTHVTGGAITLDAGAQTVLNPNTGSTYTTQATGGNETRPINIAMMYIIKY